MGLNHGGAGKGDADRSDPKVFHERIQLVTFPEGTDEEKGFVKRGGKLVKRYGPPAANPPLEVHELPQPVFPACLDRENAPGVGPLDDLDEEL